MSIRLIRMRHELFSIRKRGFFRHGKDVKGLRRGEHRYAAQAIPKIDAAKAKKDRFRMETRRALRPALPARPPAASAPGLPPETA